MKPTCWPRLALVLGLALAPAARAEEPPVIDRGARNLPVLARHGMVGGQEGTAVRGGLEILKKGGHRIALLAEEHVGLALALKSYGSGKVTLAELTAPAEALARAGIPVEEDLADSLAHAQRLKNWPSSAAIFLHQDGTPLVRGDVLKQTDLADTLATIGREGAN